MGTTSRYTPMYRVQGEVTIQNGIATIPNGDTHDLTAEAQIIQRVVSLAHHPIFPNHELVHELPEWARALADLARLVEDRD